MSEMPGTHLYEHKIETFNTVPIRQRAYRYSGPLRKEISRQVSQLLKDGIIEPSTSAMYGSPLVLVKKPNSDEYRMAGDFRVLNKYTHDQFFPLPTLPEIFDSIAGASPFWFSVLDLKSSFHQIKLHEDSKAKTTILTPDGQQYQYKYLPFGNKNSSFAMQSLMINIFQGLPISTYTQIYIDDIIIFSHTFDQHIDH